MTLITRDTMRTSQERCSNGCAQCGDVLVAPKCSEHVSERSVRHLWTCDTCGYLFETIIYLAMRAESLDADPGG
jgi:ribosomal protein L37AE/L43A